jgi:hypothetical protein
LGAAAAPSYRAAKPVLAVCERASSYTKICAAGKLLVSGIWIDFIYGQMPCAICMKIAQQGFPVENLTGCSSGKHEMPFSEFLAVIRSSA